MIEQVAVLRAIGQVHAVAADELVDVLEGLVVAAVDREPPVRRQRGRRAFVAAAAERRALDRRRRGIEGVDLDNPAETVGFVGVPGGVEALLGDLPVGARLRRDPIAHLQRVLRAGVDEAVLEILLAGQIGAPGCPAVGAAGEGAQRLAAGGVSRGAHEVGTGGGAVDGAGCGCRDASRVARRAHHLPAGVVQLDLDDRDPGGGHGLGDLFGGPSRGAVRKQQPVAVVLVIDREQPPRRTAGTIGQWIELHAVVMHSCLQRLLGGGIPGIEAERRIARRAAHRIAPGEKRLGTVAVRHHQRVVRRDRHSLETERLRVGPDCGRAARQSEHGADRESSAALQPPAARQRSRGFGQLRIRRFTVKRLGHDVRGNADDARRAIARAATRRI